MRPSDYIPGPLERVLVKILDALARFIAWLYGKLFTR